MVEYCPNCNSPYAEGDTFCGNCGQPRPSAAGAKVPVKPPTVVLRAAPVAPRAAENQETAPVKEIAQEIARAIEPATPLVVLPGVTATATEPAADSAEVAAPVPAPEPPELEDWKCAQCNTVNPGSAEYCDICGAMRVASATSHNDLADPSAAPLSYPDPPLKVVEGDGTKPGWRLRSASGTNEGVSRRGNADEDSVFTLEMQRQFMARPESFGFYIVADGMGGQAAGEVASKYAIQTIAAIALSELVRPWLEGQELPKELIAQVLERALKEAHNRIRQFNADAACDSGTTATVACVIDKLMVCANAGDSRTYLWRANPEPEEPKEPEKPAPDRSTAKTQKLNRVKPSTEAAKSPAFKIERVSRDQSLVQHLVDIGQLHPEEVYTDPRRNVVLNALGAPEESGPVDLYERELKPGDRIMLCSDGLWEMVRDPVIAEMVATATELQPAVNKLIDLANQNGGVDNVSVIIVEASYK